MPFEELITEHKRREAAALAMGGPAKLAGRAESGALNARERVDLLFDAGTFTETGRYGTSNLPEVRDSTPTDGKVTGFGAIEGRPAGVVSYDFTVKGASSSQTSNKKMQHIKDVGAERGMPVVYFCESTGVRMPDIMGGVGMGGMNDKTRFLRRRESPWASAVFGYAFGSAAWHAVAADFAVIRKGAVMAVSSPGLVSMATGQTVDRETLGGWKLHSQVTGFADAVADTDDEAVEAVRRFLSYLPSHRDEPPPVTGVPAGSGARVGELLGLLPESQSQVYDVKKVIDAIVDEGSMFELKARYARNAVTTLARLDGHSVGIVASNPLSKGGAVDADACDKITSFLVLCDSYNIPLVFLVDQPGFLVGVEAERQKIAGKVVNWMNALSLVTVPKVTVLMRKSYGQAFVNMGAANTADTVAAWWTASISFMDPRSAVRVVHGITPDEDPERYDRLLQNMSRDNTAYDLASVYGAADVIDPRETRAYLLDNLGIYQKRRTEGVGEHLLSNWPTSY
ncbi:acyl-CoA carboxylase subunit beta [Blastococcus saxobsidens]|uniref:Putative Propionyl-CoA carboxylase n=1 Tax=Blastococcus saxobsidens (strain DD2) TaxID=1146883 RepID=H6RNS1_BLASD|nr:carboxyl transferase domain-containing protein [Blastococcus saxobsidens]CCG05219.1 putative Propionyl-CoA carboxylase [Blastococcus saxobsidens DD2]